MTVAEFELAFTRCRNNLKTVGNLTVRNSLRDFDAIERYLHPKCRSVLFQKRQKLFYFHHFRVFKRCRFQNVPVRVQFFNIYRSQNVPAKNVPFSCERSLRKLGMCSENRKQNINSIASVTTNSFIFDLPDDIIKRLSKW